MRLVAESDIVPVSPACKELLVALLSFLEKAIFADSCWYKIGEHGRHFSCAFYKDEVRLTDIDSEWHVCRLGELLMMYRELEEGGQD